MFLLRYVALTALVLWVGGTLLFMLAGAASPELARLVQRVAVACGSIVLLALFAMKFLGPPPHAFPLRAAIVAAMLASALYAGLPAGRTLSRPLMAAESIAGLFLLAFYVRE